MKCFLVLCLVFPLMAYSSDWVIISTGSDSVIYGDKQSIRTQGNSVKLWLKWVYDTPQEVEHTYPVKKYTSTKSLDVYNCQDRTSTTLQTVRYSEDGSVVDSQIWKDLKSAYSEIVPDTIGESILDYVCLRKKSTNKK